MSTREADENDFEISTPSRAFYNKKGKLVFDPPVYKQRYGQIFSVLLGEKWRSQIRKIIDFGCAEFGTFTFLKRLVSVKHISFVDIDRHLLEDNVFKLRPLNIDCLKRRSNPLTVEVFTGSAGDPDIRLDDTDAVLAIELIEHLYPDVLEALPYNVFSYIKPRLFIVSTPNVDFNILFSKHGTSRQFRHPDHKFEWTREQFETWSLHLTHRFPDYNVQFIGVGCGPVGVESHGYCSQIAVFTRVNIIDEQCVCSNKFCQVQHVNYFCTCGCRKCTPKKAYGICTYYSCSKLPAAQNTHPDPEKYYELIETIEYPYEIDERSELDIMLDNIKYKINSYMYTSSYYYNEDKDRVEIPLSTLIYDNTHSQVLSVPEVSNLLLDSGYEVENCEKTNLKEKELCVVCYNRECDRLSNESEETSDHESENMNFVPKETDSDWDL